MDITGLKDQFYHYITDEAPVLFLLVNKEGTVLKTNKYSDALLGYSVVDHNIKDVFVTFGYDIDFLEKMKNPEKTYRLNLNTFTNIPETFYIHFYALDDNIIILGNVNMLEVEQLRKQLVTITSELNSVNRELQKKNVQLEQAKKRLDEIARTDPLTKLSNRRDFYELIEREVIRFERNQRPLSIVMTDIDYFKKVNDTYGHDCGDYILVSVGNIIRTEIRKQDAVGRWGGEEFILLLPHTDAKGAYNVSEKIRKKIENTTFHYSDHTLHINLTLGICEFKKNMNIKDCINKADHALYLGKQEGRNRVIVYNKQMEEQ